MLSTLFYKDFNGGDDTYIYLQYVKHILNGNGITFNAGERTYGFTSVLWLLILTILQTFIRNALTASIVASLGVSVLLIIFMWFLVYSFTGNNKIALLASFLTSLDPNVLKHSFIGMEAPLTGLLGLIAIILNKDNEGKQLKFYASGLICGLGCLNRPEMIILVILLMIDKIWNKTTIKNFFIWLVMVMLPIAVWSIFAYLYFGTCIPSTVLAKGAAYPLFMNFWQNIKDIFAILAVPYSIVIFIIVFHLVYKLATPNQYKEKWIRKNWIFYAFPIIQILVYSIMVSNELVYARYLYIFFPILILLVSEILFETLVFAKWKNSLLVAIIANFLLASFVMSWGIKSTYVQRECTKSRCIQWINRHTPQNASIATVQIGRIAYETDRKVISLNGIINPNFINYDKKGKDSEYVLKVKPDYIVIDGKSSQDKGIFENLENASVVASFEDTQTVLTRQLFHSGAKEAKTYMNIIKLAWRE